jgi:hypothetical protein
MRISLHKEKKENPLIKLLRIFSYHTTISKKKKSKGTKNQIVKNQQI